MYAVLVSFYFSINCCRSEQLNIRDLEGGRGQFFRTSCVFAPNKPADLVQTLVAARGVSVVLDLRSLDEMKTGSS